MEETLLTLHILAAGTWLGANVLQFIVTPQAQKAGGTIAASWHRTAVGLGKTLYMPAAIIALVTGFGLLNAGTNDFSMGDPFVSIGFLVIIVGTVMGMAFLAPQGRKAADARENGDDAAAADAEKKILAAAILDTVLIVVAFAAMVGNWGV